MAIVSSKTFARKSLREFWTNYSDSEDALKSWFSEASRIDRDQWESPADIKNNYPHASILLNNRVVFNIKGNNYRLVVKINYDYGQVFIRFVVTHAEYDPAKRECNDNLKRILIMQIKPIHNEDDHQKALDRIEEIFDAKPGSEKADELEILGILVDEYEKNHFPIEAPKPVEAIKFRMGQLGLEQKDLAKILGSKSRASEILSGKRSLSLGQIKLLYKKLGIPAEILIQEQEQVT
ncbi:type II toxin-antitoxin system HigB family toxin [Rhodohalobacter sp.]|uniref:type II toxin-antitoxin system HigB family toxin n=1 Tax=Rhodohalobacter sp. TaxID=1974210 RepID=UPI002ACE863C|nr:type II toxin-antitoxin system HigB family toxin [Rhodohalobacter sp.]MDZ7758583.1 type II toxin-antitoxin system HigB family toxin [Rhodohalobacter sp.]